MLSTVEERCAVLDGRRECKTTLVYKIHFVSFISSFTMIRKWRTTRTMLWASASLHNWLRSAVHMLQAAAFAGRSCKYKQPLVCAVVT